MMLAFRPEGPAKVRGHKSFAIDYRPEDLGWPEACQHVVLVRSAFYDRPFLGLDDTVMPPGSRPAKFLLPSQMTAGLNFLIGGRENLFALDGLPEFLGQPVGLAFYDNWLDFFAGSLELRQSFNSHNYGVAIDRGEPASIAEDLAAWRSLAKLGNNNYGEYHFIREFAPDGSVAFSQVKDGRHIPNDFTTTGIDGARNADARARYTSIKNELERSNAAPGTPPPLRTLTHITTTQCVDPMFLEPEAGMGWYDPNEAILYLVLGTQSPEKDSEAVRSMLAKTPVKLNAIKIISCDCGGGFGGRDVSLFPLYLALAAIESKTPVRLAYDRFEQFQSGLKRHASAVHTRLGVDAQGAFAAIQSHVVFEGGGQKNLSGAVTSLGTLHASGPYLVPRSSLHGIGTIKPGPIVGSMRGFGIPQTCFNIEVLVDRLASALARDPLELRRENLLRMGDHDAAGTDLRFHLANKEILDEAAASRLWRERDALRAARSQGDVRYGVGFAMCMEAYGTSADGALAGLAISPDGSVTVYSEAVDMGQGARASLQLGVLSILGKPADVVEMGQVCIFDFLKLETPRKDVPNTDENPRFTPSGGSTSSASKTAFFHLHVVEEVARVLWKTALAPASRALGVGVGLNDDELMACWRDGRLFVDGVFGPSLADLAKAAHGQGRSLAAIAHGYFYDGWSGATFTVDGVQRATFLDGLALCDSAALGADGGGPWKLLDRVPGSLIRPSKQKNSPRTLYASGGHVIGVEVNTRSGVIRVVDAVSIVDAGDPVKIELVEGQIEGGLAMGISHTLYETLPADIGRPRSTNLDTYRIARAADVPQGARHVQRLIMLPAGTNITGAGQPRSRRKGIGEVTMTTVGPAIANAIAHAMDHTFWPSNMPIRRHDVIHRKGAPRVDF